jgi:molybdate transport system substrate-binding protein
MKKIIAIILLVFMQSSLAMNSRNITILAEPNMVLALTKIARLYSQQSNVITTLNFASSANLIEEIDSGEPADIFISAHTSSIDTLRQKGLVDVYNIGYIARDEIIVATSKDNPSLPAALLNKNLSFVEVMQSLNQNRSTLVLDDEASALGKFSLDIVLPIASHELNLIIRDNDDKSSILNIAKSNPQYYAILLKSHIVKDRDLQILTTKKDSNIFYQALVIAGDNMEVAREFLKFLKGSKAREILLDCGFTVE